jgi:hypothetical protein
MSNPAPDPHPPRPPGTPDLDLDVPIDRGDERERPENEDVEQDSAVPEPPD